MSKFLPASLPLELCVFLELQLLLLPFLPAFWSSLLPCLLNETRGSMKIKHLPAFPTITYKYPSHIFPPFPIRMTIPFLDNCSNDRIALHNNLDKLHKQRASLKRTAVIWDKSWVLKRRTNKRIME